ncbi:MAG: CDP-glycerol glycerophosphotransferase family protein [Pseudomonadota bacterium]|nr:CDP-glycerol glycerophosphotransferase family protein [Pseudomonadota bacterium]
MTKAFNAPVRRAGIFWRKPLISLVVPSYNVSAYFDRFMESIIAQSSGTDDVEVIVVNDGSTDNTGEMANDWQRRHPTLIRVIHQENCGLCAARNVGMAVARGRWISFPDPDDFYDKDFLKHVRDEMRANAKTLVIQSNYIIYREETDQFLDQHPMSYRFKRGTVRVPTSDPKTYFPSSVNSCFLRRKYLIKHKLRFESRIQPSFEDRYLLNSLLVLEPKWDVAILPDARYYYRKRADGSSLLDGSKSKVGWYVDELKYGFLELLDLATRVRKSQPEFVRAICLYDMMWRVRHLVNKDHHLDILTLDQRAEFEALLRDIMERIGPGIIKRRQLAGCTQDHKVGLLWKYWGETPLKQIAEAREHDFRDDMFQFAICTPPGGSPDIVVQVDGSAVAPEHRSAVTSTFLDAPYHTHHAFWVKVKPGQRVSISLGDTQCEIRKGGKALGTSPRWEDLLAALNPRDVYSEKCTAVENDLRAYAVSRLAGDRFAGAWVFTDHDRRADDNAEHFYRYLQSIGQDDRAVFVIARDTRDWQRLEAEGFNLVEAGSRDHAAALVQCRYLLSSHADHFIRYPFGRNVTGDLEQSDYIFLQHGVSYNDMSRWFNGKEFKYIVTSARWETEAIGHVASNYKLSRKSIAETGLPRHDALLARQRRAGKPDAIVVAPTWRRYLTAHQQHGNSMEKARIDDFQTSLYARTWQAFLASDDLARLAAAHDLKIVFAPHPNMQMYLETFDLPDHVELFSTEGTETYQDLFTRAAVMVTDFSSVAFEVAYLERPIIYYQFDRDEAFQPGVHVYARSEWDFETDGFGPVTTTQDTAVQAISDALTGHEAPQYAARRYEAFDFRDGKCSERLYDLLAQGKRPEQMAETDRHDMAETAGRPLSFVAE